MDFIYTRQSVDRPDSISVESQLEYCQYETRGGEYQVYTDKGYSGKNTDRPDFQRMLGDIRSGKCTRVIVYKLDRISRSILDFATMLEEFQKYGVEFVSCTEKFDTSTPMGRAMLNICIVFAQLERETIQKRVADAYASRSKRGFYMGGRIPYGYSLEPYIIDGKKSSRYAINPEEAEHVRLICEMYAEPQTSFGDIVQHLGEKQITNRRSEHWERCRLTEIIKNPIYVKADLAVYEFFKAQGTIIENASSDFIGTNGCYLYTGEKADRKTKSLKGQHLVLAPHEGIVPSHIWLQARRKCLNNKQVSRPIKAKNTWLAGKIKCGKCGYALTIKKAKTKIGRYFICSHHLSGALNCDGVGGINARAFEDYIFQELHNRLKSFETLSPSSASQANPKLLELKIKSQQIEEEIDSLISKVSVANDALIAYINKRIQELNESKKVVQREISKLSQPDHQLDTPKIRGYLNAWDDISFDDKRAVVDLMIETIRATADTVEIVWRPNTSP